MNFEEFVENLRNDKEVEIKKINEDKMFGVPFASQWYGVSSILKAHIFAALDMEKNNILTDGYYKNILYTLRSEHEFRFIKDKYPVICRNYGADCKNFPFFISTNKYFYSIAEAQKFYDDGTQENPLRKKSPNGLLIQVIALCKYPELLENNIEEFINEY